MQTRLRFLSLSLLFCVTGVRLAEAAKELPQLAVSTVLCRSSDIALNQELAKYAPDSFEISLLAQSHGAAINQHHHALDEKTICIVAKPVTK